MEYLPILVGTILDSIKILVLAGTILGSITIIVLAVFRVYVFYRMGKKHGYTRTAMWNGWKTVYKERYPEKFEWWMHYYYYLTIILIIVGILLLFVSFALYLI